MTAAVWQSRELAARLAEDLAGAPADREWRRRLTPELTYGRHSGPARADARLAAVILVLCWDGGEWSLPLTLRSAALARHGGQISLPGGMVELNEDSRDAARRELWEELRQQPDLTWLGDFAPLYVYASNALVTPCVAAVDGWPEWDPHPSEVDRVLRMSLRELMNLPATGSLVVQRGPVEFVAPQMLVEGHSIWGATAVLLGELQGRLRRIANNKKD